jgi:DNA-binding GntR family transcriptional regulator
MRQVYGLHPQWTEAVIEVRLATRDEAAHLGVTLRQPVGVEA